MFEENTMIEYKTLYLHLQAASLDQFRQFFTYDQWPKPSLMHVILHFTHGSAMTGNPTGQRMLATN